jgi:hypothetical protein
MQPFSWRWVAASMGVFIAAELILGGFVGQVVVGRYASMGLRLTLQGVLALASYFVGGLLIGVISPRVRILEPATGAALSVVLMFVVTVFTPYSFIHFSTGKVIVGGAIAFFLALVGARLGERLMGNL